MGDFRRGLRDGVGDHLGRLLLAERGELRPELDADLSDLVAKV